MCPQQPTEIYNVGHLNVMQIQIFPDVMIRHDRTSLMYWHINIVRRSRRGSSRRYFAVSNITDRRSVAFDTAKDPDGYYCRRIPLYQFGVFLFLSYVSAGADRFNVLTASTRFVLTLTIQLFCVSRCQSRRRIP